METLRADAGLQGQPGCYHHCHSQNVWCQHMPVLLKAEFYYFC